MTDRRTWLESWGSWAALGLVALRRTSVPAMPDPGSGWYNVKDYGAKGDGRTDDTAALQQAISAVGASGQGLFFPGGTYRTTSPLTCSSAGLKLIGLGYLASTIEKQHPGDGLVVTKGAGFEIHGLGIRGGTQVNPRFGTSGRGVYFNGPTDDAKILSSAITLIDIGIECSPDSAKRLQVSDCFIEPYTTTPGSEGRLVWCHGPDTGATPRSFVNVVGNGVMRFDGAQDVCLSASTFRRAEIDAASFAILVMGCIWASLDQPMTIDGKTVLIMGCRFAGAVTLAPTLTGAFIGNAQTDGGFTNHSTAVVLHHPLAMNYVQLGRHTFTAGTPAAGVLAAESVSADRGDASVTLTPDVSETIQIFSAPLTQNRTVTLSTAGARNGQRFRIVRTGLGGGTLAVGGVKTIPANTAAFVDVCFNGSTWVLTGYGTL